MTVNVAWLVASDGVPVYAAVITCAPADNNAGVSDARPLASSVEEPRSTPPS